MILHLRSLALLGLVLAGLAGGGGFHQPNSAPQTCVECESPSQVQMANVRIAEATAAAGR